MEGAFPELFPYTYVLEKNARLIFFPTINFFTLKGCMIAWKRSCPDRQPFSDTFRDSYVVRSPVHI
jgi:hypothetical protein